MRSRKWYDNNRFRLLKGLPESIQVQTCLDELASSEWSIDFEKLMRNRLIMGALRYGKIGAENKPKYDRYGSMMKRIYAYGQTGNKEYLVDVANLCLLEFVECNHPNQHFSAVDDGDHVLINNN